MKSKNKKINSSKEFIHKEGSDISDDDGQDNRDSNQRHASIGSIEFNNILFSNIKMLALATLGDATQIKILAQKLRALKGNPII